MDKCLGAKNTKARDIGLVSTPGLFESQVTKCLGRGNIVDQGSIFKGIIPVCLEEAGIKEHGLDLVKECPVHAFSNAIMLWHVWCGEFLFNAFTFQVLSDGSPSIFALSIQVQDLYMLAYFDFITGDECLQLLGNIRFPVQANYEHFVGLVVNEGHEVLKAFV
jgi:hypothetical protein